jgi:hypothetical protein
VLHHRHDNVTCIGSGHAALGGGEVAVEVVDVCRARRQKAASTLAIAPTSWAESWIARLNVDAADRRLARARVTPM